jgi:protein-disulfide isomerase
VFSSLTCPHCASFHNKIFESLKKEYIDTKKIKFEHHGFPLDLAALNAERILRSIENKEKSFEFLGIIYKKQNQWAVGSDINKINDYIKKIGIEFGLNAERMNKFLIDDKIQDQILNERIEAQKKYSISSTPTIYVNEKKYKGKHEYKLFKKFLEKSL